MGQIYLSGKPGIEIKLRRSMRAKRMSLRVSALDGQVTLTLPPRVPLREGQAFARDKEEWLRSHLERLAAPCLITMGSQIPVEGELLELVPGSGRQVRIKGKELVVPGCEDQAGQRVLTWLKARARQQLTSASLHYAQKLGRDFGRITLRDTRSRWGSCSHEGNLMYSWRLILAWPEVLEYVAAHEVAHLEEMNHSPAFWATVTGLYGDWKPARKWLRESGHELHRYRFS